jgi:hypothetical protein
VYNCRNCEGVVSRDFVRVFGTAANEVFRCPACCDMTAIRNGDGVLAPARATPVHGAGRWPRR